MSRFYARNTFLIPAVLVAALFLAAASPMQAKPPKESEPSGVRAYWKCLGQCLDILAQCDKAIKRLNDPKQSMLIRVVDVDGKPIAGARVMSLITSNTENDSASEEFDRLDNLPCHVTLAKADGTARALRPTSKNHGIVILAWCDGYVSATMGWDNNEWNRKLPASSLTFKLERTQTIGGIVRDESGKPVAGAKVTLDFPENYLDEDSLLPYMPRYSRCCDEQTDAKGRWQFSGLPSRLEGLTINVERDDHIKLELDNASCKRQIEDLRSQKAVFRLTKGLVVRGTIVDSQGKPIPSAQVAISQRPYFFGNQPTIVSTDKDGRYRFAQCQPGKITVSVAAAGLVSQHRKFEIAANQPPVDFRLKPGRAVKIRVVDSKGKPLSGATIGPEDTFNLNRFHSSVVIKTPTTDQNGRWASDGEPEGKVPLVIQKEGYATVHREFSAGDEEHRVVLLPPVRFSGRIINAATRQPIRDVQISVTDKELTNEPRGLTYPSIDDKRNGSYELAFNDTHGIDRVAWQLCVKARGYVCVVSRRFEVWEGSQTMDIEMLPGPVISGVVRGPDGTPVANAKVFISTASHTASVENGRLAENGYPPISVEKTKADGRFEFAMPLEPYVVGVVHESGGAEIASQELESRGEISLQPWARVEGTVQAPDKPNPKAEESVKLTVNHIDGVYAHITSEENQLGIEWSCSCDLGPSRQFVFERVLAGHAEIEPSSIETFEDGGTGCDTYCTAAGEMVSPWRTQHITTSPGRTAHIEFACKGRPVSGRIAMPSNATRKIATTGGCGVLVFQRPIVPVPAEIAKQSVDVRKQWEKSWLESEAGQAANRAAQDHSFSVAADGAFKTEGVAPGVYKLAVELNRAGKSPDEPWDDIAWFVQEVTIPAGAKDKPLDLGKYTATATNLLRGDMAPDFEFQTADGRTHRLSEYRGKKVIVEFTEKWDAMERFGGTLEMNRRHVVGEKAGPTVWINVSSDSGPRPAVKFAQDAKFQYIQAFVPPKADVWKAYDVNRPRSWVETHIAQDGKVMRK